MNGRKDSLQSISKSKCNCLFPRGPQELQHIASWEKEWHNYLGAKNIGILERSL